MRAKLGVHPVYKRIDTCAAEFAALTSYMYSTYESPVRRRGRVRSAALGQAQSDHPRRRPEPHRPGHRVRLLLLPCVFLAGRAGLRNDHDQLQSGDGVDRLRHVGPIVFRATDGRGRARDHPCGRKERLARRRDRAARRTDAAEARGRLGPSGCADPRHIGRCDRSRRRPQALPAAADKARSEAAEERHRAGHRNGRHGGARDRLSGNLASVIRARRQAA